MKMDGTEDHSERGLMQPENQTDLDTSHFDHEIYMCIVWQGGQLGLSHYDVNNLQIHFMPDMLETDDFFLIKQAVHQIHPVVIVLNSVHDGRLLLCLKKIDFEVSKRRILALNLPSVPRHFTDTERLLYFSSLISMKSTNMVRSVGGLLKYLEKTRVGIELESDTDQVPVLGFKTFIPESQIEMDCQTYCALKVFGMEQHPSVFKSGGHTGKEALSLFGILNRCKSTIGSRRLREWFLKPLKDSGKIKQRYDAISFLMSTHNMETVSSLEGCLKHIKFLPKILLRMSKAQASAGDWISLYKTLYHAVYIKNICKTLLKENEIFVKIRNSFTGDLLKCMNLIKKTINFDESKVKKRFVVQANVDPNLDEKKRFFNGLPDLMTRVAREEIESLNQEIQHCIVTYLPEIGYLLVINMPEGKTTDDDHTIEGLDLKFVSSNHLFYKSPKTKELDNILGDTEQEILEMEFLIMHNLQFTILENTQAMLDVMNFAAELDCLIALARCANEFGYVRPNLIEENVIDIKGGRHPLQELCCNPFVPNDTSLGGQYHKMKLITGPNACGKSVYLKQVALVIFMAHIGSFVPAASASIGPINAIFSRIKSTESISVQMSTFMQDISQVSEALRSATSCSLVILDEFGKGTKSEDGLSLLTAVLKFWIDRGHHRPFTLVSTHFHSIIQQKLLPHGEMENLTFDTLCNNNELVFLYQLVPGHTSSSFACHIAAQMGTPPMVATRGNQVSELICQYKTVTVEEDDTSKKQRKQHEKIVASFLSVDLNTADAKRFLTNQVLKLSQSKSNQGLPNNTDGHRPSLRVPQLSEKARHSDVSGHQSINHRSETQIGTKQTGPKDSSISGPEPKTCSSSLKESDCYDVKSDHSDQVSCLHNTSKQSEVPGKDGLMMTETGYTENAVNVMIMNFDSDSEQYIQHSVDPSNGEKDKNININNTKYCYSSAISFSPQSISGESVSSKNHTISTVKTTQISHKKMKYDNSSNGNMHQRDNGYSTSTSFGYAKESSTSTSKLCHSSNSVNSLKQSHTENVEFMNLQKTRNDEILNQTHSRKMILEKVSLTQSSSYAQPFQKNDLQLLVDAGALKQSSGLPGIRHNTAHCVPTSKQNALFFRKSVHQSLSQSCVSSKVLSPDSKLSQSKHFQFGMHTSKSSSLITSQFTSDENLVFSESEQSQSKE